MAEFYCAPSWGYRLNLTAVLGVVLRPLLFLIYAGAGLIPRDPRQWAFGSWDGQRFTDNSAALFRHVAQRADPRVRALWISHDPAIVRRLRERGFVAYHAWSPAGIRACCTAGVFIYGGLTKDINHWLSRGARRVLLRHGVGVKKIERAIDSPGHHLYQLFHGNALQRLFWNFLLPWHAVRPDFTIATCPDHARQGEVFFGIPPDAIAITGFPRNDELLAGAHQPLPADLERWLRECRDLARPVFLYLPTFRDDAARLAFRWEELDAAAGRAGVRLIVKLHFIDVRRGLGRQPGGSGNLYLADPALDPNTLFPAVDGLVSDFSSVAYDFLLTRKPVVFYVPDYEQFLRSRSLYFDFEEVTPGAKARNLEELSQAMAAAARNGRAEWTAHYERVLARFHTHQDALASERVYREILGRFVPDSQAVR